MFYDLLDESRRGLLPSLANFKTTFYLAGGTALALQLGHRLSEDFDFFSPHDLDTNQLFEQARQILTGHQLDRVQEEKNTLSLIVDGKIKLSFFTYSYPLLEPLIETEYLHLASIADIGCMKLAAIVSRATMKDYVDLYCILKQLDLKELLNLAQKKSPALDPQLILKSLVYFDDLLPETLIFPPGQAIDLSLVKKTLETEVKNYLTIFNIPRGV